MPKIVKRLQCGLKELPQRTMVAIDTETTGLDLHHGAQPYFVTACFDDMTQRYWPDQGPRSGSIVDPVTRKVTWDQLDLDEIRRIISSADRLLFHNAKFDLAALATIGIFLPEDRWADVEDSLLASHLLASNKPHNLTDLGVQYLGVDIHPLEVKLRQAVLEARRLCKSKFPHWRIAKEGLPEMPSARGESKEKQAGGLPKSSPWGFDMWLPRALAEELGLEDDDSWWTVLAEYSNADSAVTMALWRVMETELHRRGLWAIYRERMRLVPIAFEMEAKGVTVSRQRLEELVDGYGYDSQRYGQTCVEIARKRGHRLVLPKSGSNASLHQFCFGDDGLSLEPIVSAKSKTGNPSLAKEQIDHYLNTLPPDSDQLRFIKALARKRKKDTQVQYLRGYQRYGVEVLNDFLRLHPSLNPTGTDTLRWSSSHPNSQNTGKQENVCEVCDGDGCGDCGMTGIDKRSLRWVFGPAPGREWWSMDAKNIELRIPAYESGEQEMIELFERPDDPPFFGSNHLLVASILWPEKFERCERDGEPFKKRYRDTLYQWVKNGNFAVQYGCQERKADDTFRLDGAYRLIKKRFAKLAAHNDWCIKFASKHGYIETIPDRSVDPERGYPVLCTRMDNGRILPTVPLNYRTQSTAMQWTNKAMIRCHEQIKEWRGKGFNMRITVQQHDELVFDMPAWGDPSKDVDKSRPGGMKLFRTSNLWRAKVLQRLMEQGGQDIGIPTPVNVEYHKTSWAEGVTL